MIELRLQWNKVTRTAAMSSIEFALYALRALALANCTFSVNRSSQPFISSVKWTTDSLQTRNR